MGIKKLGRPLVGGPRINVRLKDDNQLMQLEKKVESINNKSKFGEKVTRNSFVVEAIAAAIKRKGP